MYTFFARIHDVISHKTVCFIVNLVLKSFMTIGKAGLNILAAKKRKGIIPGVVKFFYYRLANIHFPISLSVLLKNIYRCYFT